MSAEVSYTAEYWGRHKDFPNDSTWLSLHSYEYPCYY